MRRGDLLRVENLAIRSQPAGELVAIPGSDAGFVIGQVTFRIIPDTADSVRVPDFITRLGNDRSFGKLDSCFLDLLLLLGCLLYTSPSPRDQRGSRMPSSA